MSSCICSHLVINRLEFIIKLFDHLLLLSICSLRKHKFLFPLIYGFLMFRFYRLNLSLKTWYSICCLFLCRLKSWWQITWLSLKSLYLWFILFNILIKIIDSLLGLPAVGFNDLIKPRLIDIMFLSRRIYNLTFMKPSRATIWKAIIYICRRTNSIMKPSSLSIFTIKIQAQIKSIIHQFSIWWIKRSLNSIIQILFKAFKIFRNITRLQWHLSKLLFKLFNLLIKL